MKILKPDDQSRADTACGLAAIVVTGYLITFVAYIFAGFDITWACWVGAAYVFLTPFYIHVWNRSQTHKQDVFGWLTNTVYALAIVGALMLCDFIVGKGANPEKSFWSAFASNPTFLATAFVSPIVPAALSGLIRSILCNRFVR